MGEGNEKGSLVVQAMAKAPTAHTTKTQNQTTQHLSACCCSSTIAPVLQSPAIHGCQLYAQTHRRTHAHSPTRRREFTTDTHHSHITWAISRLAPHTPSHARTLNRVVLGIPEVSSLLYNAQTACTAQTRADICCVSCEPFTACLLRYYGFGHPASLVPSPTKTSVLIA